MRMIGLTLAGCSLDDRFPKRTEAEQIFRAQVLQINRLFRKQDAKAWRHYIQDRGVQGREAAALVAQAPGCCHGRRRRKAKSVSVRPLSEAELNVNAAL